MTSELNSTQFEVITVEGHTDRLGAPAYNQQLSMRRAEAVKAGDCKGGQALAKLIACLQADRRVDVDVTGTR